MRRLARVMPALVVLGLVLVAAQPWSLPAGYRFLLPLLPVLAVAHFALLRPALMPAGVAFMGGLLLDVLTIGPLGYWAMIYVLARMLAALLSPPTLPGAAARVGLAALMLAVVAISAWLVALPLGGTLADWRPLATAALGALAVYPLLLLLARPLDTMLALGETIRLERGS